MGEEEEEEGVAASSSVGGERPGEWDHDRRMEVVGSRCVGLWATVRWGSGGMGMGMSVGSGRGRFALVGLLRRRRRGRGRGALGGRASLHRCRSSRLDQVLALAAAEVAYAGVCVRWPLQSDTVMAWDWVGVLEDFP